MRELFESGNPMIDATYAEVTDGEIVTRDAEEWRREFLARHVVELPTFVERREWLNKYQKLHGPADLDALKVTIRAVQNKRIL